jgi:hypothetical protein
MLDLKFELLHSHIVQSQNTIMMSRWFLFISEYSDCFFRHLEPGPAGLLRDKILKDLLNAMELSRDYKIVSF